MPLLVAAVILAVALVTGQLVRREIAGILLENAEQRLAAGAERVSALVGSGIPAARAQLLELGADPQLRAAFTGPRDSAAIQRRLAAINTGSADDRDLRQLFAADGSLRWSESRLAAADTVSWGERRARARSLDAEQVEIGPLLSYGDSAVGFALSVPVRAADGRLLGWMVELRRARGTNVDQVRELLDVDRLLIGSREGNVWTDLSVRRPAPPHRDTVGVVQRVLRNDSVEVLGVVQPVAQTPWLLWVEEPLSDVLAPMQRFLRRLWLAMLGIALLGAAAAWWIGAYTSRRIRAVAGELDRTLQPAPEEGVRTGAALPATDVDELRRLEQSFAALETRVASRRKLDEQLLQSQKLEAVGRLAGGIAHDFNNLLTVIGNYIGLVAERLPARSAEVADLAEARAACERAAALTRQLLAFSRQRLHDVRDVDVNTVVRETARLVARLIPSNVERELDLGSDVPQVRADPVQLEQILLNLVVNAADAMPDGGRLVIRTSREMLDPIEAGGQGTRVGGPHACIAVSDSGVGMDAETLARIFDPFFTTKAIGKGTGLGLATVHGIVQAAGGRIWPYSEPGRGTTMKIYLPAIGAARPQRRVSVPVTAPPLPPGLVLVADDDDSTRGVLTRLLQHAGHAVHAVPRADDALAWLRRRPRDQWPIAVICDVMMPGLNGIAFARIASAEFPELPLVLISGYTDVRERVDDALLERVIVLEKPFTATALHAAMHRALAPADQA